MDDLQNFPLKEDDIWIVTFPKCGTTWMQETISMLVNDVDQVSFGKSEIVQLIFNGKENFTYININVHFFFTLISRSMVKYL